VRQNGNYTVRLGMSQRSDRLNPAARHGESARGPSFEGIFGVW